MEGLTERGHVARRVRFIGVTPQQSASRELFGPWAAALEQPDLALLPVPVPLDADEAIYRQVVDDLLADERCMGALVTSHKTGVLTAAGDDVVELTSDAAWSEEVSALRVTSSGLVGHATDPVASLRALDAIDGAERCDGATVVCLGSGGAARALLGALSRRAGDDGPRPARLVVVGNDAGSLDAGVAVVGEQATASGLPLDVVLAENPTAAAEVVSGEAPGSIVVNTTGVGKDVPGSPLADHVRFPEGALVWDVNYRGDLGLLQQAAAQADERGLRLEDGWRYFVEGWFEVLSFLLDVEPDDGRRDAFHAAAAGHQRLRSHPTA